MKYLVTGFSLRMVTPGDIVISEPIDSTQIPEDVVSHVGFQEKVSILQKELKRNIALNKSPVYLNGGDEVYLAQFSGERIPAGAESLPNHSQLRFLRIRIISQEDFKKLLQIRMLNPNMIWDYLYPNQPMKPVVNYAANSCEAMYMED